MTMEATSSVDTSGGDTGGAPPSTNEGGGLQGVGGRVVGEPDPRDDDKGEPRAKPKDKPTAAEVARYKARINGAEVEHDGATLAKMLSDEYEHEFPGPGGRPHKATRADMIRLAQQGIGWEQKMRDAAAREQRAAAELELARKDPKARMAYMMTKLGIEDPDQFVIDAYEALDSKRRAIVQLQKEGRGAEAYKLTQELVQERMEREQLLAREIEKREQQERQHEQAMQQHRGKLQQAFQKLGVQLSAETYALAEKAGKHWADLGYEKTYDDIAAEVAKEVRNQFHTRLRSIPREKLLTELPEDWRRTMRELEAEAAKVAKKEERAAPKDEDQRREPARDQGLSEAEHVRRMRGRS